MHKTDAGNKRKELNALANAYLKAAQCLPPGSRGAEQLLLKAARTKSQAEKLAPLVRLQDLHVWVMEKTVVTRRGPKTYRYWLATWREKGKPHNEYLGSCEKVSARDALAKARKIKKEALNGT